ncbi:MAG TPA: elongation factor P [Candidatus Saccharimonadales bacterium]|jgi:elongation factor P|nr:elongation factor P [Candidatus Saccharimonadales bacterium]
MSLSITDLKKGVIFQLDSVPYRVIDYSQKVMGRGSSIVSVRIKSLLDGKVLDKTFKGNEQINTADITNRAMQFLYSDDSKLYLMDDETYDQLSAALSLVGDSLSFIKEGDHVTAQLFEGRIINIELAKKVPLKVTYTENVVKGDTSSSVLKEARLETGLTVKVPAFIKQDDIIIVNTRTGEYIERAKR